MNHSKKQNNFLRNYIELSKVVIVTLFVLVIPEIISRCASFTFRKMLCMLAGFLIFGCQSKSKSLNIDDVEVIALAETSSLITKEEKVLWLEDLDYLVEEIHRLHPDPFYSGNQKEFNDIYSWICENIDRMDREEIIICYMRLLAQIGNNGKDGHTGLWPYMDPANFHLYPLRLYWFDDGIYIVDSETDRDLKGAKLLSINNVLVEDIVERLSPFVSRDGPNWLKSWIPVHMLSPEFQRALQFSGKNDSSEFRLLLDDEEFVITLKSIPHEAYHERFPMYLWQGILPYNQYVRYLNKSDDYFWYELLEDSRSLYFQMRAVVSQNNDGKTLEETVQEMTSLVNNGSVDRFIIDLRLNGGGDNSVYTPLLDFISRDTFFKNKGRLYILIGRATFSAGINFVTDAEISSNAILVGEPTGGSPNQYGDPEGIILPNSKVRARISTIYWNKIEKDKRLDHHPSISVPVVSNDYFKNRDRVLDTIINY